jgi:hypothetical protein
MIDPATSSERRPRVQQGKVFLLRKMGTARWTPSVRDIGFWLLVIVLATVAQILDAKSIIPSRLFGWISSDRKTQNSILLYGLIGGCLIVRFITRAKKRAPAVKS